MNPSWAKRILQIAGVYNMLWGAFVILFPLSLFQFFAMPVPTYPGIWQCVGMIVGVYGLGYYLAAFKPFENWIIILVGLLGKVLGPLGFFYSVYLGHFPVKFIWVLLFNDFIWWVPFFLILKTSWRLKHATQS